MCELCIMHVILYMKRYTIIYIEYIYIYKSKII